MPTETKDDGYYATGRRKESNARVWLFKGQKGFTVNGLDFTKYVQRVDLRALVEQPLKDTNLLNQFRVRASVQGGGVAGQAGAIQLGISRALLRYDEKLKSTLRKNGHLTRDPRQKERKKPGRKGARRSFQFTKR